MASFKWSILLAFLMPCLLISAATNSTPSEAEVLQDMIHYFKSAADWKKSEHFDKKKVVDGPRTLQGALIASYIAVIGKYKHRGKASKALRLAVKANPKYEKHFHPIHGFNEQANVFFPDIIAVIEEAKNFLLTL